MSGQASSQVVLRPQNISRGVNNQVVPDLVFPLLNRFSKLSSFLLLGFKVLVLKFVSVALPVSHFHLFHSVEEVLLGILSLLKTSPLDLLLLFGTFKLILVLLTDIFERVSLLVWVSVWVLLVRANFVNARIVHQNLVASLFEVQQSFLSCDVLRDLVADDHENQANVDGYVEVDRVQEVPSEFVADRRVWTVASEVEQVDAETQDTPLVENLHCIVSSVNHWFHPNQVLTQKLSEVQRAAKLHNAGRTHEHSVKREEKTS